VSLVEIYPPRACDQRSNISRFEFQSRGRAVMTELRRRKRNCWGLWNLSKNTCSVRVARDAVYVSMPDCLPLTCIFPWFLFVHFRNSIISGPRKRRGFSAYACKVHLTECMSAKTTSARLPSGRVGYPRYRLSCLLTILFKHELQYAGARSASPREACLDTVYFPVICTVYVLLPYWQDSYSTVYCTHLT
jgi:hypothetical protein